MRFFFDLSRPAALVFQRRLMRVATSALLVAHAGMAHANDNDAAIRAAQFDDVKAMQRLLARGVDPNLSDARRVPLLLLAAREKSGKVAALLIDNPRTDIEKLDPAGENALMLAALNGDQALVQRLIAKGAEVNKPGWTPLHYAATPWA